MLDGWTDRAGHAVKGRWETHGQWDANERGRKSGGARLPVVGIARQWGLEVVTAAGC